MLSRRSFFAWGAAALMAAQFVTVCASAQIRPNILFIFSGGHAVQSIGAYGPKNYTPPHPGRITNEGVKKQYEVPPYEPLPERKP